MVDGPVKDARSTGSSGTRSVLAARKLMLLPLRLPASKQSGKFWVRMYALSTPPLHCSPFSPVLLGVTWILIGTFVVFASIVYPLVAYYCSPTSIRSTFAGRETVLLPWRQSVLSALPGSPRRSPSWLRPRRVMMRPTGMCPWRMRRRRRILQRKWKLLRPGAMMFFEAPTTPPPNPQMQGVVCSLGVGVVHPHHCIWFTSHLQHWHGSWS